MNNTFAGSVTTLPEPQGCTHFSIRDNQGLTVQVTFTEQRGRLNQRPEVETVGWGRVHV